MRTSRAFWPGRSGSGRGVSSRRMMFRALSDAVVFIHLAFILFVVVGGFLAWRWRWVVWAHIPAVVWGVAIIVIGFDCPLTPLEKELRERGGEASYEGGFIDRYVEGVIYPEEYTPHLRALAALLIVAAYARLLRGRKRDPRLAADHTDIG